MRKTFILPAFLFAVVLAIPSLNGLWTPGCSGGMCHAYQTDMMNVTVGPNGDVSVTIPGVTGTLAGELVIVSSNQVVSVVDSTTSNPFTLMAPQSGYYYVNAGYMGPYERKFVTVNITPVEPTTLGSIRVLYR